MTTEISLEFVKRPDSKYGPAFEIVLVQITFEDETHYTTERIESYYFPDEQTAKRAYTMAKSIIQLAKEEATK